jgi:hypothetical protein
MTRKQGSMKDQALHLRVTGDVQWLCFWQDMKHSRRSPDMLMMTRQQESALLHGEQAHLSSAQAT